MSDSHEGLGYSVLKLFIILFALTAGEVAWGMLLRGTPRWFLWGGLMAFAVAKGWLIFAYFMHMRYEKALVWSLIIPTPFLIMVVMFALMPDLSFNDQRDHPVSDMMNASGEVVPFGLTPGEHDGHGGGEAASH